MCRQEPEKKNPMTQKQRSILSVITAYIVVRIFVATKKQQFINDYLLLKINVMKFLKNKLFKKNDSTRMQI